MVTRAIALALLVALACIARSAQAQTVPSPSEPSAQAVEDAKRLFHEGIALVAKEHWLDAESRFQQSVALVPRASSLYNWALSLFALKRDEECIAATQRVVALAPDGQSTEYHDYAMELRDRAQLKQREREQTAAPHEPAAQPSVIPPSNVPPSAVHPNAAAQRTEAPLVPRAEPRPVLELPPPEPPRDDGISAAWLVMGGGALMLAGALVTALLADDADSEFTSSCPTARECDPSLKPVQRRAKSLALATDILLVAGTATVGTGVTLFLLDDGDADAVDGAGLAWQGAWP